MKMAWNNSISLKAANELFSVLGVEILNENGAYISRFENSQERIITASTLMVCMKATLQHIYKALVAQAR